MGRISDWNRDGEYKPSPQYSLSQTGPNEPDNWVGPGTGTGSTWEEEESVF